MAVRKAFGVLEELGAIITDVSWPMYHESLAIANTILLAEGAASLGELARTQGPHLYPPVRLRIEAGFFVSAADYLQAQRARVLFIRDSHELLSKVDVLAGPTLPVTAYKIGAQEIKVGDQMAGPVTALTQYTRPFNLNGFPAITVPCGFSDEGLPVGLQLAGKPFDEETLLRVAHAYEQATDWHKTPPAVVGWAGTDQLQALPVATALELDDSPEALLGFEMARPYYCPVLFPSVQHGFAVFAGSVACPNRVERTSQAPAPVPERGLGRRPRRRFLLRGL